MSLSNALWRKQNPSSPRLEVSGCKLLRVVGTAEAVPFRGLDSDTHFSPAFSAASFAVALQSSSSIPRAIAVSA